MRRMTGPSARRQLPDDFLEAVRLACSAARHRVEFDKTGNESDPAIGWRVLVAPGGSEARVYLPDAGAKDQFYPLVRAALHGGDYAVRRGDGHPYLEVAPR